MLDVRSGLLKEGALPENFEKFNFSSVIHEAQKGNAVCRDVIVNAGRYLGIGITNLMKMFDPALIILGGELIAADRLLLQAVNDSVKERIAPLDLEPERIIIGNLGPDAVSVGAATIVLQRALDPSRLYQTLYHSQVDI
jgi:predicted NBD/HSP70 family sugar kinase